MQLNEHKSKKKKRTAGLHFALHYIDKKPRRELALKLQIYCHLQKLSAIV